MDCKGPTNVFFLRIGVGTGVFPVCGGPQIIDLRPAFRGTNTLEMYRLAIDEVPSIGDCQSNRGKAAVILTTGST